MLKYYIIGGLLLLNLFIIYFESKKEKQMSKKKRPCNFNQRVLVPKEERTNSNLFEMKNRKGMFHQWGTESQEFENGATESTIGIVESENGQIHSVLPHDIQFTD